MIYPDNFENKIGFNEIRKMLRERCLSPLGKEQVDKMAFSDEAEEVNEWLMQVREFRRLMEEVELGRRRAFRFETFACNHRRHGEDSES